jgi:hypothetical protein
MKIKKYTAEEIREAVDIATGDDGFRSKEVISILETNVKQNTEEYLKEKNEPIKFDFTSLNDLIKEELNE